MIRHIVFFSAKSPQEQDAIEQGLKLLADIPESLFFEVAKNSKRDGLSQEVDFVVYAEFADYEALERYKQHALYEKAITLVRPIRDMRIAVDFESSGRQSLKARA